MPPRADHAAPARLSTQELLAYGCFSLPLAMAALPIFVYVPKFYSDRVGLSLGLIGAVLLGVRSLDAVSDPLFGWWVDRGLGRAGSARWGGYARGVVVALPLLLFGYPALFNPPHAATLGAFGGAAWLALALIVVYAGFSLATIAYYSWGAALGQDPPERARVTGWREGAGLIGVLLAAAVPVDGLSLTFCLVLLVTAAILVARAPRYRVLAPPHPVALRSLFTLPLSNQPFRRLLLTFFANGTASAIPATLFLFYVQDVLAESARYPVFLGVYFLSGALSMPLWMKLARSWGLAPTWLLSMAASVASFVWAGFLGPHQIIPYTTICVISGMALGADLALPPALLAGVIDGAGHRGAREGAYFGLWTLATKLNLALASGIALPLLGLLGYHPGHGAGALDHLSPLALVYAVVPCFLKLIAAGLLWSQYRSDRRIAVAS